MYTSFEDLVGKTIKAVYIPDSNDIITFACDDGSEYKMYHDQDCCESVYVEDVCGDWNDLVGSPIVFAEETTSSDRIKGVDVYYDDSFTWTFYRLRTNKGTVVIRWFGSSNGYYSESVTFDKVS